MERTLSRIQVLLVEDEPAHVELIRRSFEGRTDPVVDLRVASTMATAFDEIGRQPPDLVLLYYLLPDGKATHFLAELPLMRRFPVVIMSSHGNEQVAVQVMKAGALDYVIKSDHSFSEMPHLVRRTLREWRLTQQHLKAQDELQRFFNLAQDMLGISDYGGYLKQVNPSFENLLGFQQHELYNRSLLDFVHKDDQAHTKTFLEDAAAVHASLSFETRLLCRDGSVKWVEWVVQPYATRQLLYMAGRDITERKHAEEQLIMAKEAAEEMATLKTAFMANMSHEIRTPLTSILGFTSILSEEVDGNHRELVDTIERSGRRLMRTLNSVLDLSLLESGSLKAHPERLEIVREVRDAVEGLMPVAERKGLTLTIHANLPKIYCSVDRACLTRILDNLIDNGIKFTESGGVSVVIRTEGTKVFIDVIDTGIGISPMFVNQLYDDFKQESTGIARSFEGVGLGLSITKRLAALIGADLEVSTRKGEGTRFSVALTYEEPIWSILGEDVRLESGSWSKMQPTTAMRRPRVLSVEDQADARMLVEHVLDSYCDITCVPTALDVLDKIAHETYDVILVDINLGLGMNGSELAAALREHLGEQTPPLIAVTAFALPGDAQRFLSNGFDGYVSKPFKPEQLLATVFMHAGVATRSKFRNVR